MSSNTCMFKLWGFSCLLQFGGGGVLHLQNERLLYSANLFPMEGPYSECRYCLLILSEKFGIQNAILYIEYGDVTTVTFLHKCYKNLFSTFSYAITKESIALVCG